MRVALGAAPVRLEGGEEAAAIHALCERVSCRQRLQLLVLAVDLIARLLQHLEHLPQASRFLFNGRDVVESRQRATAAAIAAENWRAIDTKCAGRIRFI